MKPNRSLSSSFCYRLLMFDHFGWLCSSKYVPMILCPYCTMHISHYPPYWLVMFCAYETFWLYNVIFSSVIYFLKNYLLFSKQKIIEMNRSSTHRSVSSNTRTSFTLWLTIIFVLTFIFLFQNVDGASLTANIGNQSKIFSRQTRENSFTVFNESESIGSIQNVNNTTANLSIHPEDEQFQDFMPDYVSLFNSCWLLTIILKKIF